MTKQELITTLAEDAHVTKRHAEYMLVKLTNIIEKSVTRGEKVNITGFGTFDLGTRKKRQGINPNTKARLPIPAMKIPRFRAGSRFKSIVRKVKAH